MDADDEAVLNLIAECEWGLSNPPGSSSQKECESDFHGPQGARLLPPEGQRPSSAPRRAARLSEKLPLDADRSRSPACCRQQ